MGLLTGKKAFVSGGSRGLGRSIATIFAKEGADVAFNYANHQAGADEVVQIIEGYGRQALPFKVSVTDKAGVDQMAKEVIQAFGQIDILVNNAAINRGDNFATMTEKAWLEVINVNVNGLYYITKPFFKQMMRQRAGNILNISSIGGIRALPTSVHYSTTKAAVIGFTKCLSREAGPFGISVNAIAAGILETELGDALPEQFKELYRGWCAKGRFGHPDELAEFAAFMTSDRNTYMTGEVVTLDGGAVG